MHSRTQDAAIIVALALASCSTPATHWSATKRSNERSFAAQPSQLYSFRAGRLSSSWFEPSTERDEAFEGIRLRLGVNGDGAAQDKNKVNGDGAAKNKEAQDKKKADERKKEQAMLGNTFGESLGRFTYGFYTGVIFSQTNGDFSESDPYVRFIGDTAWGDDTSGWRDFHTGVDLMLTTIPVEDSSKQFIDSQKSLSGSLGIDWRWIHWDATNKYKLTLGPVGRFGFDTQTSNSGGDSTSDYWTAGVRLAGYPVIDKNKNPLPRHYASVQWGDFETLGAKRIVIDMGLVLDPKTGFFLGIQSNTGSGADDIRIVAGFAKSTLPKLLSGLRNTGSNNQ